MHISEKTTKLINLIHVCDEVYQYCMKEAVKARDIIEVETLFLVNAWNASQDRDKYIETLKGLPCR